VLLPDPPQRLRRHQPDIHATMPGPWTATWGYVMLNGEKSAKGYDVLSRRPNVPDV
jgi:hypothetical protein